MALFGRKAAPTGNEPALTGNIGELLEEIAATPQQRRFTAEIGEARVVIDTSNREVVALISVEPASLPHADVLAIKARDDDILDQQLAQFGTFLAALARLEGKIRVTSVAAPLRYSAKLQGFSRAELSKATLAALATEPTPAAPQAKAAPPVTAPSMAQSAPRPAPMPAPATAQASRFDQFAFGDTLLFSQVAPWSRRAIVAEWDGNILASHGEVDDLTPLMGHILRDFGAFQDNIETVLPGRNALVLRTDGHSDVILSVVIDENVLTLFESTVAGFGRWVRLL